MSYLEPLSFCSIEEYKRHEVRRSNVEDFQPRQLYTFMGELSGDNRDAVRGTVRLLGFSIVQRSVLVAFCDKNLNELTERQLQFDSASFATPSEPIEIYDRRNNHAPHRVIEGYLRDYFDDNFERLLQESLDYQLVG